MAQLPQAFDANQHAPNEGLELINEGWHPGIITHSEIKANNAKTGHYLELEVTLTPPDMQAGQKTWARLNVDNPNPKAVEIANGELSAICRATGVMVITDSVQLHGIPLQFRVKHRTDPEYGKQGDVTGWRSAANAITVQAGAMPASHPPVPPPMPQAAPPMPQAAPQPVAAQPEAPVPAPPYVAPPVAPQVPVQPQPAAAPMAPPVPPPLPQQPASPVPTPEPVPVPAAAPVAPTPGGPMPWDVPQQS